MYGWGGCSRVLLFVALNALCFRPISWHVLIMLHACSSLILECPRTVFSHYGPLGFGCHSYGLDPLVGLKFGVLLHALLACFV